MPENKQLDADFVQFIAGKVRDVESPMNLTQLCGEFKKKNGTSSSEHTLLMRLQKIRNKLSEMEEFDTETKVKMMFSLGAPVSDGFLIELRKQADVELDNRHRIIKYKKHGNRFQLSGVHVTLARSSETEIMKRMMKFLAEMSENATSPMADKEFLKEFNYSVGNMARDDYFQKRKYDLLKQHIYLAPEFDQETKIKMLFLSNTKVHANILEELRQDAFVEVDEYQMITKYKANNGSLNLEGQRRKFGSFLEWSKDEEDKLLNFIAEQSKETKVPLTIKRLSREFANKSKNSRTVQAVAFHIRRCLLPKISELNNFDVETRVRMLFALGAPVHQGFLQNLQEEADVEVDEYQRITKYKANDSSLKLETVRRPKGWCEEENDKLLNFLSEKSIQTEEPLLIKHLSREFAEKDEVSRTVQAVELYIHRRLLSEIWKMNDFNMETRVKMLFALSVSIEESVLNELRENALVKIDRKRRITEYKANDGSLELTRDRSVPSKIKARRARKISHGEISEVSETDEEIENDEDEEKEEGEENNEDDDEEEGSEDEEDDDTINTYTTRSGRLSKKRCPGNDFSSDSDDFTCESFKNKKESRNKKTGETTKRSNSTSQNLKGRKSRNTYFSDTDDESEDEESDEEYEEEEEEVEANSSTTKSERTKKRYPDIDFSYDFDRNFDNVSLDSPQNSNDSNKEKDTEKLVDLSSDSSPKVQRIENQKRKIVESSSDTTSSSSKSRKRRIVADTQNDTKTDKVASGTMQNNDREAIHNDPGETPHPIELPVKQESPSHKKVKREDEDIKPDRSFLCGTTQSNVQNVSGTEESRTVDADRSPENTEEMTSGKEFMKSLSGLVHTLDSSIFNELQSKIEKAIKEIGDGDHLIPTDEIARTLHTGLYILNKNATRKPPRGESTSLRDFFLILQSTLSTFRCSSLMSFELKLKKNIKELNGQDKVILVDSIERVLETVFLLVSP